MGRLSSEATQLVSGQEIIKSYVLIFGTCYPELKYQKIFLLYFTKAKSKPQYIKWQDPEGRFWREYSYQKNNLEIYGYMT